MNKIQFVLKRLCLCLMTAVLFAGCEKDPAIGVYEVTEDGWKTPELIRGAVTDIDGNVYDAVQIGSQIWMAQNLRATRYADGTSLYSYYAESYVRFYTIEDSVDYGVLYNWKAVMRNSSSSSSNPSGVQGICPDGWHVPSDAEWTQLTDYVSSQIQYTCDGNSTHIAKALAANVDWNESGNPGAIGNSLASNNATGFSALPAGYHTFEYFGHEGMKNQACFWSATSLDALNAYSRKLKYESSVVSDENISSRETGLSVRCIRD